MHFILIESEPFYLMIKENSFNFRFTKKMFGEYLFCLANNFVSKYLLHYYVINKNKTKKLHKLDLGKPIAQISEYVVSKNKAPKSAN